jgi:hypothetical protein
MPSTRQAVLEDELSRRRPHMSDEHRSRLAEQLETALETADEERVNVRSRDRAAGLVLAIVVLGAGITLGATVDAEAATAWLLGFAAGGVIGHWLISVYEADGQVTWILRVSKEALAFGAILAAVLAAWIRTAEGRGVQFLVALSVVLSLALMFAYLNHRSIKRHGFAPAEVKEPSAAPMPERLD